MSKALRREMATVRLTKAEKDYIVAQSKKGTISDGLIHILNEYSKSKQQYKDKQKFGAVAELYDQDNLTTSIADLYEENPSRHSLAANLFWPAMLTFAFYMIYRKTKQ